MAISLTGVASQPQIVVDGDSNLLLGAEVAFSGLDGGVSEQELDLFEVAAVLAAEFGAGAAQIGDTSRKGILPQKRPENLALRCP